MFPFSQTETPNSQPLFVDNLLAPELTIQDFPYQVPVTPSCNEDTVTCGSPCQEPDLEVPDPLTTSHATETVQEDPMQVIQANTRRSSRTTHKSL